MIKEWSDEAWEEFLEQVKKDRNFLKRIENIHPLNSVFGIILGLKVFGFIGLIFGPLLISITMLLIQGYHDEFSENDKKEENDTDETEEISENIPL